MFASLFIHPPDPEGKRRIRVHTLCLPVVNQLSDVYAGADVQAITCLLANMGESVLLILRQEVGVKKHVSHTEDESRRCTWRLKQHGSKTQ